MRQRLRRSKSITPKPNLKKPLRLRRPRRKADSMTELDPVTVSGDRIAEPVAAPIVTPPPRKSRVGVFFFGALSGCLIVFAGMLLFGILIAAMANSDATTRGDVFGDKVAIIPIDGEIFGSRETIDALH